jgi:hypothetical protein
MKRVDLVRAIEGMGCELVRHGDLVPLDHTGRDGTLVQARFSSKNRRS